MLLEVYMVRFRNYTQQVGFTFDYLKAIGNIDINFLAMA
jgi:hypothetical protein